MTKAGQRWRIFASLFLLVMMTGCITLGPDFTDPEAPIATSWQTKDASLSEKPRIFRKMLFARVVPNLKRLGLVTPRVRSAFEKLEIIQFEEHDPEAQDREFGFA